MTKEREEAIAILQTMEYTLSNQVGSTYCQKKYDAIRFAIKVLKQEPCEDSVNRADLLKQFEDRFIELQKLKHIKENKSLENEQLGINWCINTLKDMPPATSIRKKGKWIGDNAYPICPKCNCNIIEEYISCLDYAEMYKPMKYCPNCGAEMTEDEE
jgi:hypothetical protein